MAVELISEPDVDCPNPVTECLVWCVDSDDFIIDECDTPSNSVIDAPDAAGKAPDATEFTILNTTFTVDSGQPFTNTSFAYDLVSSVQTMENVINMITSNQVSFGYIVTGNHYGTGFQITITACECGFIDPFVFDVTPLNWTSVETNPTNTLDLDDTYRYLIQLMCDDCTPLTELMAYSPIYRNGASVPQCVDLSGFIPLSTDPPEYDLLRTIDIIDDATKDVYIRYGSRTVDGCTVNYGQFATSDPVTVINSAFQINDPDKFTPYCFDGTFGVTKFLTTNPRREVCADEWVWLYYHSNVNKFYGSLVPKFVRYRKSGAAPVDVPIGTKDGLYFIASGNNGIPLVLNVGDSYTVQVFATIVGDFAISEEITFTVVDCCCEGANNEIYFLDAPGGYSTMRFDCLKSIDIEQEGTEVCINIPCEGTFEEKLTTGGRSSGVRDSKELITLYLNQPNCDEWLTFFKNFKASRHHYIRSLDTNGDEIIRKLFVPPSGVRIFEKGDLLQLTVSGYFHTDLKTAL